MRIDRFLSDMGIASRRESQAAARRGQILVDGVPIRDASRHIDPTVQTVSYAGRQITYRRYTYVMLNKPQGYVSATEDGRLPVVTELLPEEYRRLSLFPVGRLDRDTVGLMLLTDHGALAHTLLSPRHHVEKEYTFVSERPLSPGAEDSFAAGVTLADGTLCRPAHLTLAPDRTAGRVVLTEGKYHQIKRMVAALGGCVVSLERIRFDTLLLDATLARGACRPLTQQEIAALLSHLPGAGTADS